jgi:Fe-S cluster assembly ATP-binding protein
MEASAQANGHLEINNLSLVLGEEPVLRSVNVDFWLGHVHAVIGPNGAGKTTLAKTIMGLSGYREHEGDILLDGQSIVDASIDERARMGITLGWQEPARYEGLRTRDFILAGARDPSEAALRDVLERVALSPRRYADRAIDRSLSGGERKRIELASILAMQPRVVMLDEPDSGIDVEALNRIFEAIQSLKDEGSTVIMITHSMTVLRHAEHAFLFCCGRLVDKGAVDRIGYYFENECIPCDHVDPPKVQLLNVEATP